MGYVYSISSPNMRSVQRCGGVASVVGASSLHFTFGGDMVTLQIPLQMFQGVPRVAVIFIGNPVRVRHDEFVGMPTFAFDFAVTRGSSCMCCG